MVTCYHTVPDIAPTIMLIRDSPLYLVQLMVGFASSKMNAIINNRGTDAIADIRAWGCTNHQHIPNLL